MHAAISSAAKLVLEGVVEKRAMAAVTISDI